LRWTHERGSGEVTASQPVRAPSTEPRLRAWQRAALRTYSDGGRPRDFLVTATPGAGKTTFALTLARGLIGARIVDRVIVVCPTDHLRTQWADAAASVSLALDPALPNSVGPVRPGCQGYVTTYAQVAATPALHAARAGSRRSLVVFDEVHTSGKSAALRKPPSATGTPTRYVTAWCDRWSSPPIPGPHGGATVPDR
jgi:superfamily II DNA or RNA helicase